MSAPSPVFAIVAGEASGDILGANLIRALKQLFPDAIFEGIGGPQMQAESFRSLYEMDRLSVMGLVEPLKRLPELLRIRRNIVRRYSNNRPAVFIGIDSPDFNSGIEQRLHRAGVKTVHYVSPSVWAWRQGRIKKIKKSVDLMLTLLPFEADFYRQHQVPVCFVGHPLAQQFGDKPDKNSACTELGLDPQRPVLCIMPGSRSSEVELLANLFLDAAEVVRQTWNADIQLVIPAANQARYQQVEEILGHRPNLNILLLQQQSHLAMEAADVVLLASGTTALEAMLLKKPMVVSYRFGAWTYKLLSRLIKTPYASIPNLLANKMLVPELIQDDASVDNLSAAVIDAFDADRRELLQVEFARLQEQLAVDSGAVAARAISELLAQ
ncbi:MAG: lipid-A-disaccharide synthase [Porticoccaceae bacterium]|jgi:lipid-A-disaccharide synthase|nr:lipid-A-disaccharide synthase [Porticoccaceae bacterium]